MLDTTMKIKLITSKMLLLFLTIGMLTSCSFKKQIVYLQAEKSTNVPLELSKYEPLIQADDEITILVSAENPEVAAPYNLKLGNTANTSNSQISYLIDKEGTIDFPILGKIKLAGLTRIQAVDKIKTLLANDIKEPTVTLKIINFKVSVLGEVGSPGVKTIQSERLTLLDAISLSGDLTIYGKRNSIMIIREIEGVRTIEKIDITKRDFMNSPYYYLAHNDIIYVEPNKTRINSSVVGPNISIIVSVLSLIITVLTLTTR
jgi:polysaccharide export outer membrane protein